MKTFESSMVKHCLYLATTVVRSMTEEIVYISKAMKYLWKLIFSSDTSKNDNLDFTMYHIYYWY